MNNERILVIENDLVTRDRLCNLISGWGYDVESADDGPEALQKIGILKPALIITNLIMPNMDGLELLRQLNKELPHVSAIIISGRGTANMAVQAMREGAYDYLTKPIDIQRLQILIEKALEKEEILTRMEVAVRDLQDLGKFGRLTGESDPMLKLYNLIKQVAPSSASVLICGRSGTGKEMVARTIHDMSLRKDKPFITLNCSAIPDTLIESELFGHERGAFTGADHRRIGCFELADGGTLFLDEIADMKPEMQVKLLRVLEDSKLRRLGGKESIVLDVRMLAATNRNINDALEKGILRSDLYYRLKVFTINLPDLVERKDDIHILISEFIREFNTKYGKSIKSVDNETMQILMNHHWPGNVRELRHAIERAVIVCDMDLIQPRHLPNDLQMNAKLNQNYISIQIGKTLDEIEREVILKTLDNMNGNKTKSANVLGISIKTLYNKLNRYGFYENAK